MSERTYQATVDQVDEDVVVLDVDGYAVKLPRELLPVDDVREGAGFTIAIKESSKTREDLARSVADRLAALTGASAGAASGAASGATSASEKPAASEKGPPGDKSAAGDRPASDAEPSAGERKSDDEKK